jgi:hypothetical protein
MACPYLPLRNTTRRSSTFTSIPSVGARHGVPLPSVKEYNEKVEYVHLNLVRRGTPWRAPTFVKIGAPPTRLEMVQLQRIFRRQRGRAKAAVRLDHRPREDALRSPSPYLTGHTRPASQRRRRRPQKRRSALRGRRHLLYCTHVVLYAGGYHIFFTLKHFADSSQ